MGIAADLIALVEARIKASLSRITTAGTVAQVSGSTVYVTIDGSSIALPVRYVAGLNLTEDTRVTLTRHLDDWVVTGAFNRSQTLLTPKFDPLTGWGHYGGIFGDVIYWRDQAGKVHLEGAASAGTTTVGTQICQLAEGYRPNRTLIFESVSATGIGRVEVKPTGWILTGTGLSAYANLSTVSFLAMQ